MIQDVSETKLVRTTLAAPARGGYPSDSSLSLATATHCASLPRASRIQNIRRTLRLSPELEERASLNCRTASTRCSEQPGRPDAHATGRT